MQTEDKHYLWFTWLGSSHISGSTRTLCAVHTLKMSAEQRGKRTPSKQNIPQCTQQFNERESTSTESADAVHGGGRFFSSWFITGIRCIMGRATG
jgi:hypothetical protein